MKKIILTILSLSLSIFTYAELSYQFAQITHTSIDDDLGDASITSFDISTEAGENIFSVWSYGKGDFDDLDIDVNLFEFGLGYHTPISESADFVSLIEYYRGDTDGLVNSDLDGYGISIGIRAKLAEKVEFLVGVTYSDIDIEIGGVSVSNYDTDFGANVSLDLTDSLQAVIDLDGDDRSLGLRLHL